MESEFIYNLKKTSLEAIIIGLLVFGFTMLIKWQIKKLTAKLDENKRKAVNTIIVFIPMILSLIFSTLYFGIFKSDWFGTTTFDCSATAYIFAVTVYAVFSRIIIVIKGAKNSDVSQSYDREFIKSIKTKITDFTQVLKLDEKKLIKVIDEINRLLSIRENLIQNSNIQDISATEKLDNQIYDLETQKTYIQEAINQAKIEIENCKNQLIKKGEN